MDWEWFFYHNTSRYKLQVRTLHNEVKFRSRMDAYCYVNQIWKVWFVIVKFCVTVQEYVICECEDCAGFFFQF